MTTLGTSNMTTAELTAFEARMAGGDAALTLPVARERPKQAKGVAEYSDEPKAHAHHFVIATPDGSHERPGRCKTCGEERMFNIAGPIDPWDSTQIESRKRGVGRARQARKEMMS